MSAFTPYRPRKPNGCAICGFPASAGIHSAPDAPETRVSHMAHAFRPKIDAAAEIEYASWIAALSLPGDAQGGQQP